MISHTVRATSHETPASKLVNLPATDMPKLSSPPTHVTQQCLHTAWPEHQSLVTRLCNRLLPYTCACGSRIIHTPHICGLTQVVWSHHHCNTPCNGALEADSLTMSLPEGQELLLVGGWMQQQCAGLRQALFPRFFLFAARSHSRAGPIERNTSSMCISVVRTIPRTAPWPSSEPPAWRWPPFFKIMLGACVVRVRLLGGKEQDPSLNQIQHTLKKPWLHCL